MAKRARNKDETLHDALAELGVRHVSSRIEGKRDLYQGDRFVGTFDAKEGWEHVARVRANEAANMHDSRRTKYDCCPTCQMGWWLNAPAKVSGSNAFRCVGCKAIYTGEQRAALDLLAALQSMLETHGGLEQSPAAKSARAAIAKATGAA